MRVKALNRNAMSSGAHDSYSTIIIVRSPTADSGGWGTSQNRRPAKVHTLPRGKLITNQHTQSFGTLQAAICSRQVAAQEAAIRCLVCRPSACRELQINGGGCIMLLFE